MKQLSEQCISGSRANLRGILIDRCQRLWGRSFRTHHDREANQFFHSGHFVIQSLRLRISSGLRTANHLCKGDDGDGDVWGAAAAWTQNSFNSHCLQTDTHYRSFSTKPSGALWFITFKERTTRTASVKCDGVSAREALKSQWRPPKIVALPAWVDFSLLG